jgi:ABC-2 type transport system ATP-binding protein
VADPVIEVSGLQMRYGRREAVRGIDLAVARGEVFAFLGPNGAGKTTTVEILEGYRHRTGGAVSVLGEDPARAGGDWRGRVGVVLQSSQVERELTVREVLRLYSGYHPRPLPIDEVLGLAGLAEQADVRGGRLSGGQQRRVDVALALIGDPELVFLDEPTTGFDPAARRTAWEVIHGLQQLGKTIFLTTHYMEEAETLADRIAVIVDGRIVGEGTPSTLGARDRAATRISFVLPSVVAPDALPAAVRGGMLDGSGRYAVATEHPMVALQALSTWALERGHDLADVDVRRPSLEDVYLELTGGT